MLRSILLGCVLVAIFVLGAMLGAGSAPALPPGLGYVPGQVIIKFKSTASQSDKDKVLGDLGGDRIKGLGRVKAELRGLRSSLTVDEAVARYRNHPKVQYIEPNFLLQADRIPNDPRFSELWGMSNTGQTGGTPGADIHAVTAWDHFQGSNQVLIGVIDTGVDYTHPDLAANIWTNAGEVPNNGVDDDHNGYVDDVHGWDFVNNDNNPIDDNGHGTHVSGTIGAVGDNGIGVAGVNWRVKIMPLKFLNSGGSGNIADAVLAVEYATMMHVNLTSNSWGGGGFSQGLVDAITEAGNQGILFVAAAGNSGVNTDQSPHYPSAYPLDNIISVAATDHNDQLAGFSNYGVQSVDLAAPGVNILSTFPGASYGSISGTSMATPHVSGVLGLVFGRFPDISYRDAKALVLNSVDRLPSLNGRVMTGGRLNAWLPIADPDSIPPAPVLDLAVAESGSNWLRVGWTAPGDDGATGTASRYEVKISTAPLSEANFNAAPSAGDVSDPGAPGSAESLQIKGLQFTTFYYIALKTIDDYGNVSSISNVVSAPTLGAPHGDVLPTSLAQTLVTGSTADPMLTLSNVGQGTLDFEIPTPTLATASVPLAEFTDLPKGAVDTRVGPPVTEGSGGPDGFGYRWTDSDQPGGPAFDWVEISGTGTQILSQVDDLNVGPFSIGFPFEFYGAEYTTVRVSSNGLLSFTDNSASYSNQPLPNPNAPLNMVAPFWDDLFIAPGKVYYRSEPGRFIVQWDKVSHLGGGGPYTFEVVLSSTGSIKFQYLSVAPPLDVATIGIQNATGDDGLQVAFNTPYVHNNLAVQLQSVPQWLHVTPEAGTVRALESTSLNVHIDPAGLLGGTYQAAIHILSNDPADSDLTVPVTLTVIGAPDIAASPNGLSFGQVILGTAPTATIRIDNLGTDSLHVASIGISDPVFHADASSAVVPPRESRMVTVTFTPVAVQTSVATMTITSDDPDTPVLVLPLSGEGIPAPVIGVTPTSLGESLFTGNSSEQLLTVSNTGGSQLNLNVEVETPLQGAMTPEQAVSAIIARSGIQNGPISITGIRRSIGGYTAQTITRPEDVASVSYSNHPLSGVSIALVSAEDPVFNADVQAKLVATGRFSSVTQIDARVVTPTLGELQAFDAVMVWSDYPYFDANQLGNNLADYVDGGGGVVSMIFEVAILEPGYSLAGRWASQGYFVFARSSYQAGNPATLGAVLEPGHPTMQGVSTFDGGNYSFRPSTLDLTPGATLVARWSDDVPLVAVKNIGTTKRADLGFFPVSSDMDGGFWQTDTDGALLMANALEWTAGPAWLSVDPDQGSIAPGANLTLHARFDAEGLDGGPYDAAVAITSNDPHRSLVRIPVHLDVTGAPDVAVVPGALDFGIQLIGDTKTLSVRVKNEGTAPLHVTGIDLSHADYTASANAFTLAPRETLAVQVQYAPTSTGPRPGTLTLHSDDPDTPALVVALSGEGIPAPVIGVAPALLSEALLTGNSSEKTFVVSNTGGSNLNVKLDVQATIAGAMTPEQVATAIIGRSGILSGPLSVAQVSAAGGESVKQETLTQPSDVAFVGYSEHPLTGLDVALVSADETAFDVDVQNKLLATGRFSSVTRLDARFATPTLAELQAFDAIMVVSDYPYSDGNQLGDNVASYVDGGGGVVSAMFEVAAITQNGYLYNLGGRWESQSYFVLTRSNRRIGPNATLGAVFDPSHPVMQGVSSFNGGSSSYRPISSILTPGATLIANWSDGTPLVATKQIGVVNRVDLAFFPPSSTVRSDFWQANTDGALLMANALQWTAGPGWLSVSPAEGTVAPGGSLTFHARFDAEGLNGGSYDAVIAILSNDPYARLVRIPAHLDVTGAPDVAVSPAALDFGVQLIGDTKTLSLRVKNEGSETLHVTGIDLSHTDYTATPNAFMLAPLETLAVQVRYAPTSIGPRPGTLTLHSDDPDTPSLAIALNGEGIPAPDIAVSPSSLSASLFTGDSSSQLLNVANTGGSNLYVQLAKKNVDGLAVPAYSPPHASAEGRTSSTEDTTPAPTVSAAGTPRILVIQETSAWGVFMNTVLDTNFHLPCTVIPSFAIGGTNFSNYDLIITVGDESSTYYSALSANVAKFEAFVSSGGVVQYQLATQGSNVQIPGGALVEFGDIEQQNRVLLPNHPIVQGLPALLLGNAANHCTLRNLPPGTQVVTDSNNLHLPTTVEYRLGSGHVIATGMTWEFLYNYNYNSGPMLLKALTYSLSLIGPSWLSLDPEDATVPPGQNRDVQVSFDAARLNGGIYRAQIEILSNDPDERNLSVPVELHVTGAGRLQLSPTALDFGALFVGRVHDLPLTVSNVGTDVLNVTSMMADLDDYLVFESSLSLVPGQSQVVLVRFQPLAPGDRSGTLTFVSNDPHSPTMLALSGTGVAPPVAVATPASLEGAAMPGGTKTKTLRLCNNGGSNLEYTITAESPPAPPPNGPRLALHVRNHTSKAVQTCRAAEDGGSAPTNIPCSSYVTQAPTGVGQDIYVVVAGADVVGVTGLTCGISYDNLPAHGVDVISWTFCGDGLQFPSDTWPASGGGNRMTWLTCQNREIPPDGVHAIAGSFYVYAYSSDAFRATENRTVGTPELKYANCSNVEVDIPVTAAGMVRFSNGATLPGFNPCAGGVLVYDGLGLPKGTEDRRIGTPVVEGKGGPDHFGHRWVDSDDPGGPVFDWTDIRSVGTQIPISGDDQNSGPLPIGFIFPFYGTEFQNFTVCSNGWISLSSWRTDWLNQPLPSTQSPENMIAGFWDDLYMSSRKAYYYNDGSRLIVQFQDVTRSLDGGIFTFQIILNPDGTILYQYLTMHGVVNNATVGIQNGQQDDGLTVAFNTAFLHDNLAVSINTAPSWLSVQPAGGVLPPAQCIDLQVIMSALNLVPNQYQATLSILSNDPVNPTLTRDVLFHVGTTNATVADVDPNTLNGGSSGKWVTAYVELPPELNPADILLETVRALGTVPADSSFDQVGDFNLNGVPDRTLKFDRGAFIQALPDADSVQVVITGEVRDQTYFVAQDGIRILRPHLRTLNAGGSFMTGSAVEIRWDIPHSWTPDHSDLFYSSDNGTTWTLIAGGVHGQSYVWRFPSSLTDQGRVAVYAYGTDGLLGTDRSDQSFKVVNSVTGVAEESPPAYGMLQNVPNPFSGSTSIHFSLLKDERVVISVFDLNGRLVRELVNGALPSGPHQVMWDGRSTAGMKVASGLYLYRMETKGYTVGKRMYLLH